MSIHPFLQKIKAFVLQVEFEAYFMIFTIILVGLAGFGLGRLSNAGEGKAVIIQTETSGVLEQNPAQAIPVQNSASAIESLLPANGSSIVTSKNGTKYYLPGCSGVGRILEKNRVYFTSEKEAVDAGYTKASGC